MTIQAPLRPITVIPPCMLIVAATYGMARYSLGLFLPAMRADLGIDISTIATIISFSYLGYLLATGVASALSGLIGPRILVFAGGAAATIGMALLATPAKTWLFAIGIFIAGMSPGLAYPPLSDAITRLVQEKSRGWVYAIVNSGTSIGIILCIPLALVFDDNWRLIYACFAVATACITFWVSWIMPSGGFIEQQTGIVKRVSFAWLCNRQSTPLYFSSFIFGFVSSTMWTFAPDLLSQSNRASDSYIALFWVIMGVGGLLGGVLPRFLRQHTLTPIFLTGLCLLLIPTAVIPLILDSTLLVLICGFCFGTSFISITGFFGIWSMYVFHQRPSMGFGVVFLIISCGQFLGTIASGYMIEIFNHSITFFASAGVGCLLFAISSKKIKLI